MSADRKPCPWHEAALEFARLNKSFIAIDPRSNAKAWCAWRNYFRWLNWAPFWFLEVERLHDERRDSPATWTAPIDHPDRFTVPFEPIKGPPPMFPLTVLKPLIAFSADERRAHVKRVRMPEDAKNDLRKSWWQRLTPDDARAIQAKYELEAQQQQQTDGDLV